MSTWTKQKIGEVSAVIPGFAFKSSDFSEQGKPIIKIKNIQSNFSVSINDCDFVNDEVFEKRNLEKYRIRPKEALIAMTGATIGKVGRFTAEKKIYLNQRVALFRPQKINNDFLWSLLRSQKYQEILKRIGGGAAQANMSSFQIEEIEIETPDLPTQTRIASVLSAYDDLIENNEKRIKRLEEMAQLLYTEWFVKFKFPGHEKAKMVDSGTEYGKIPERWKVKKLGDFAKLISRGSSLTYVENGGIPVVNQRCVRNGLVQWEAVQYAKPLNNRSEDLYLNKYDCLINSMGVGTLGRVSRNLSILGKAIVHNCITLIRTQKPNTDSAYLYYFVKSKENYFISSGVGATGQTSLKPEIAANLLMLIPKATILEKYSEVVIPMWNEMSLLLQKNQNLSSARDLLIPQLVTGRRELK